MENQECPECGAKTLKSFVQHASFFTRCISCKYEGPATSWLVIAPNIKETIRAILVSESCEELALVSTGTGSEILEPVSGAASQGKLILLDNEG